ncbi:hypothetical protein FS837_004001, partial [Tulasnella sp. UAMH 9824]
QTRPPLSQPLEAHRQSVTSVAFSPDSKALASGSDDGTLRLWNAPTWSPFGEPLKGRSQWVTSVAFSPDSKMVVSESADGTIQVWNADTGEPFDGHCEWLGSVNVSPDGKLGAGIHQQSTMDFTSWPEIKLSIKDQWLTLGDDRLLWLPDEYWRGFPAVAKLFKGTVVFTSDEVLSFFNVSDALGPLVH